jgi:hypothetical protein
MAWTSSGWREIKIEKEVQTSVGSINISDNVKKMQALPPCPSGGSAIVSHAKH